MSASAKLKDSDVGAERQIQTKKLKATSKNDDENDGNLSHYYSSSEIKLFYINIKRFVKLIKDKFSQIYSESRTDQFISEAEYQIEHFDVVSTNLQTLIKSYKTYQFKKYFQMFPDEPQFLRE